MTKSNITRRRLLRTTGLTFSLPLLASLPDMPFLQSACGDEASSGDPDDRTPRRFCCIFFPNGVSLPPADHAAHRDWHWFPHQTGADYQFTRSLSPLEPHRKRLSILSGLSHPAMRGTIAHITADSFLTGADTSRVYNNTISVDQLFAQKIGNQTRFASLALSSDGGVGVPGRTRTLSFSASGRPVPSLSSPREIFNRLFGVQDQTLAQQRRAFGRDRSILDHVLAESEAMQKKLSAGDRRRWDEYTTSVREIEQRLESADKWLDTKRPSVDAGDFELSVTPKDDAEDYIRVIFDLMHVALLTDSTRAITYQITSEDAKGIGDHFPKSIGLPGHHALSHGTNKKDGYEQWGRYDRFLASQLAYFVDRLSKTEDPAGGGTLLDHTSVLYGCSTSDTHKAVNYPLILAGGESMGFRHGLHRRFDSDAYRMSDLFVTLLSRLGVPTDRFSDSTRSLGQLLS